MPKPVPPEAAKRYRRAAVFLIHWLDKEDAEGTLEILREVEDDDEGDGIAMAAFTCTLAELSWQMAQAGNPEAAEQYVRAVAADAALDEVRVTDAH